MVRTARACLGLFALSSILIDQTNVQPQPETPPPAVLKAKKIAVEGKSTKLPGSGVEVRGYFTAKEVEIRIGTSVLTADEALIERHPGGDSIELIGNVRLKTRFTLAR